MVNTTENGCQNLICHIEIGVNESHPETECAVRVVPAVTRNDIAVSRSVDTEEVPTGIELRRIYQLALWCCFADQCSPFFVIATIEIDACQECAV